MGKLSEEEIQEITKEAEKEVISILESTELEPRYFTEEEKAAITVCYPDVETNLRIGDSVEVCLKTGKVRWIKEPRDMDEVTRLFWDSLEKSFSGGEY